MVRLVVTSVLATLVFACSGSASDGTDSAAGEMNATASVIPDKGDYTLDDTARGGTLTIESASATEITFSLDVVNDFGGNNMGDLESVKATKTQSGFTFASAEDDCTMVLGVSRGVISLKQTGTCGFGANVIADGSYKKAAAAPASATGCAPEEQTLFTCASRKQKMISVCASSDLSATSGYIQYRFGTAQKLELSLPVDAGRADFRSSTVGGNPMFAGGGASYLKFKPAGANVTYVVYTAIGRGFDEDGVAVLQGDKLIASFKCSAPATSQLSTDLLVKAGVTDEPEPDLGFALPTPN